MTAQSIILSLPWPPDELHPNKAVRLHWSVKAKARRMYREQVGWIAKEEVYHPPGQRVGNIRILPFNPPVIAQVTFFVPDRRRRDTDNLMTSLKAAWDGIVDAGILKDDSSDLLHHETPIVQYRPADKFEVQIILTELLYNSRRYDV